ncbi:undecaprenyl-diphosphate phosphatase [Lampropedia aestuarii]|uniref:Undecaprenyl-diphosphatase n=1 Tax=Lampropedia aestuarii TaxID=2562762 RepID=A0A4S5BV88_9BURK|nr:undecaprenyl-diphosphate phosphatase [Lampropedia aestuarii]MDH5857486.1 undecaprenyl-diphosphate phosphatase [Lampropedia aestuarii]THJ35253.1 undecaprenyl-diphosphate phosphatase [Lampropedia aestuarii]
MSWFEAIILGLVQGLTEFLPVSSSAHLRILGPLLPSGGDPGAAFTAITQLGTEAAVLIYFRKDLWRICSAWLSGLGQPLAKQNTDARMGWFIILGTIPIVVLGLLFHSAIESVLRNLYITATMLIVFALVLAFADFKGSKTRSIDQLTWRHAVVFGLAQAMALIPGVSRSGGTITGGLLLGYSREAAARYSFLLAIPAVIASGFYQLFKSWGDSAVAAGPTLLATAIAFISGYAVIVVFLKWISHHSYLVFVAYRIALGLMVFGLLAAGILSPT